ncbi:MAG: hypothetical protein Kow001_03330 [Acidobacteriota bacterium]
MIYLFPFAVDIVVALLLFVGRHALAAQGASEAVVASIPVAFGLGYTLSGPVMRRIIHPRRARLQMVMALGGLALAALVLAWNQEVLVTQALFALIPFTVSLFFNAFQSFMLGVSRARRRPLQLTVGLYTFSWALGFALGPFVCGLALRALTWSQTYYLAATASLVIAGAALAVRSPQPVDSSGHPDAVRSGAFGPQLLVPGWLGLVIGLVGWLVIATYWPVIAEHRAVSPEERGLVEFSWGATLAVTALVLTLPRGWPYRPWLLAGFGMLAVSSLVVFGGADSTPGYLAGVALMGAYAATTFSFSLFHCLREAAKAASRVAVNEMMVGVSYLVGPLIAAGFHRNGEDFSAALARVAALVAAAVGVQTWLALRSVRKAALGSSGGGGLQGRPPAGPAKPD